MLTGFDSHEMYGLFYAVTYAYVRGGGCPSLQHFMKEMIQ